MIALALRSVAVTHPGAVRTRNEDSIVDRPDLGLWAVADGAGGHGSGDVASQAVAAALECIPPGLSAAEMLAQVRLRIASVHADLRRQAEALGPDRIICTTLVLLLARGDHFACLWAGDSRAYLVRDGAFQQITRDHSYVQTLVDAGALAPEDADSHPQANVILRAVGAGDSLELDKVSGRLHAGDRLLLCSDGLFKAVPETEIGGMLTRDADAAALIGTAVERGARDNVSAVVVEGAPAAEDDQTIPPSRSAATSDAE